MNIKTTWTTDEKQDLGKMKEDFINLPGFPQFLQNVQNDIDEYILDWIMIAPIAIIGRASVL